MRAYPLRLALLLAGLLAVAADWSRFRGPNGTGVSADKTIPVTWTDDDILWKQEMPGPSEIWPPLITFRAMTLPWLARQWTPPYSEAMVKPSRRAPRRKWKCTSPRRIVPGPVALTATESRMARISR